MVQSISPNEAQGLIAAGGVDVIDVREPSEWATGHVPGARLMPLGELKQNPGSVPVQNKLLFICAKGGRSMSAATFAESLGAAQTYSVDGGTEAWRAAGLPIEVPPPPAKAVAPRVEPEVVVTETDEPGLDGLVGANLRELRAKKGFTLDVLAQATGLSRALLGQIELGRAAPSVSVLWKIARVFDVPLSALLSAPVVVETKVLRNATAKRLVSPDGRYSSRALFPFGEQNKVEFYELRLAAHAREDAEAHAAGTRENLVIVAGRLELVLGSDRFELAKGDAIVFGADKPHSYVNLGSDECFMHLVMTYA